MWFPFKPLSRVCYWIIAVHCKKELRDQYRFFSPLNVLICHLLGSSQTNREPHVSCLVRSTVQPKETSRSWMDLPRIVTNASSAACCRSQKRHVCRPQLHSLLRVVVFLPHTYTAYYRWRHLWKTAGTDLVSHPVAWRILCFLPRNTVGIPYVMRRKLRIFHILIDSFHFFFFYFRCRTAG